VTELAHALEAHLRAHAPSFERVAALEPLGGGACQDNYRVALTFADGERAMVLRSDAKRSLQGSLNRSAEHAVISAAVAAGVKTPAARWLAKDLARPGAFAYLLDWVDGVAIGRRVVRDADLAQAREQLAEQCAIELAKIHSVTPESVNLPLAPNTDPVAARLKDAVDAVDDLREPRPALELALRWLAENPPRDRAVVLVHGDFRTGNFLVGQAGLNAVLDWEFAHWGARAEDLAWVCMRNWRFGVNDKACGGFATRQALYEAYERATGKPVDIRDVHYWEVLGNVRWAAGCVQQGERYLSGGEDDLELIAIPRRAMEMEFEALRLIERGAR
jgi:aminoglycoside phosphotransferase (APT) family kinase protein